MRYEAEAAQLYKKIKDLLKATQQKATVRRQHEDLFILSSAHDRSIRLFFGGNAASLDEVRTLLKESGEEEIIEEECFCRYEAFVKSKGLIFASAGAYLDSVSTLLSESIFDDPHGTNFKCARNELPPRMGLLYGELHEFSFFWDAVARLHRLTTTEFMDRMLSASLSEDNSLLAEEEKMNAREALLNAAVCDHEKLASNITTRVQNIQPERALLKAACEDGAAREKIAPVAASSQEDENAVAAAKHALESLHAATESLLKRKQEADSAKNAVCDKLGEVTDHISALKQAVNSISLIAEEMTGAAGELRAKCVCLRRELDSKERYCFEQDRLLTEAESNYEELKSMVSQLADDESAKTAQLNNAELEHRGICLRIDSAKQKAVAVRAANAKLKELLEVAQSEGKFLTQEVQYLENLVPDKAILERVVHHGAPNPECKHPLPATRGFLDFVQKARVSQRTRLECT